MEAIVGAALGGIGACLGAVISSINRLSGVFRSRCCGNRCFKFSHQETEESGENEEQSKDEQESTNE